MIFFQQIQVRNAVYLTSDVIKHYLKMWNNWCLKKPVSIKTTITMFIFLMKNTTQKACLTQYSTQIFFITINNESSSLYQAGERVYRTCQLRLWDNFSNICLKYTIEKEIGEIYLEKSYHQNNLSRQFSKKIN